MGGFTLVEQLIVIGLIAALIGLVASGLSERSGQGIALQTAQTEVANLLRSARAQAVLQQSTVRLLVSATAALGDDPGNYLRCLQVVRADPNASGEWLRASEMVFLPRAIGVVPPMVTPLQLCDGVTWPGGPSAPVSTLSGPEPFTVAGADFGDAFFVEYAADGAPDPTVTKLAFATVQRSAGSLPRFDNPSAVRGLLLRASGTIIPVNDASAF